MHDSADAPLASAANPELRDHQKTPMSVTWPFSTIQASDYWSLSETHRQIVEQTVATLITALHEGQNKA